MFLLCVVLRQVGPQEVLSSRPDHVVGTEILRHWFLRLGKFLHFFLHCCIMPVLKDSPREFKSLSKHAKPRSSPCSASPQPSRELIHAMCRLSPSRAGQDRGSSSSLSLVESPCRPFSDLSVMKSSSDVQVWSYTDRSVGFGSRWWRVLSFLTLYTLEVVRI